MTTNDIVDLRSDTVTRPSPEMRRAIAEAEVGDDVLGDDPTVQLLQEQTAELLGKEASLFFPSGTQANQAGILVNTRPGTEAICEANAHVLHYEFAGAAAWSGVQLRPVATEDGVLTADLARELIRPESPHLMQTTLLCAENTHNMAGGKVMPLETLKGLRGLASEHGLALHLDGARLWNAAAATGTPASDFAAQADTVMVCFSKGLGAPVGSALAGTAETIGRAHEWRKRLGGGMRQVGILAAAGIYALEHNVERLAEDHANARRLARGLSDLSGVELVGEPETNIVLFRVPDGAGFLRRARERDLWLGAIDARTLRAVTHLDVSASDVDAALGRIEEVLE